MGGGGGGGRVGGGEGGQGGCERRIEVFVKIQKKFGGGVHGRVGGVRVDVIEGVRWGVGLVGGGGVRVDVNEDLKFL